ncbi:MAG: hypothetical protein ABIP93_06860 [Gemmatimonadaceae bacterium]
MSNVRRTPAGATRPCPHCRAVILQSMTVCPTCRKHLKFSPSGDAVVPTFSPLRVEGSIRHPNEGEAWEYSVMVTITNDRGEEIGRQVVGVGALQPGEERKFTFAVEVFAPGLAIEPKAGDSGVRPVTPRGTDVFQKYS